MGKFLDIARMILMQEKRPMRATEIIESAREKGFMDFSGGETPHQTIKARISEDIKRKKDKSDFKRIAKGIFALRDFEKKEYDAIPFEKRIGQQENVLVIKADRINHIGRFNGIKRKNYQKYLSLILNKKNTFFMPRLKAEKDVDHKQILSYILVEKDKKILRFIRGVYTNAHSMLRGSLCIGFGGHVQDHDLDLFETLDNDNGYFNSVRRELLEELKLGDDAVNSKTLKTIGVLNDDSSEVGKSHFAIIHKLTLDHIKIHDIRKLKGEKSINQLTLVPTFEIGDDFEKYEYWSKLCIKAFYNKYIRVTCKIHRVKNYSLAKHSRIIVIVGAIGSGKTEASKILEKNFGYNFISSGMILQGLMGSQPIDKIGRKDFQNIAYDFILKDGNIEIFANKILENININSESKYVIDGIRNIKTYLILKSKLGRDCTLIFVESTPNNCYSFYKKREKLQLPIDKFYEYINHPVEQDIKLILGKANIVVYNLGSLGSYQDQIKRFFKGELNE